MFMFTVYGEQFFRIQFFHPSIGNDNIAIMAK